MKQTITDSGHQGEQTLSAFKLATLLHPIPQVGARVSSVIGEANTVGMVVLAPGPGLDKDTRAQIVSAHSAVCCSVRAERVPGYAKRPPVAFHAPTLLWMTEAADYLAIWSAPGTELSDEVATAGIAAVNNGARFPVTYETDIEGVAEWAAFVRRYKRAAAQLVFFGPEHGETVH
jgi:hypothetical protein